MANQTPLTTVLAFFGSTCHYLEVTTKMILFCPPYIGNNAAVVAALMIVNGVLALGYVVFAWKVMGWLGKSLKFFGTALDRTHVCIGELATRGMRYVAWCMMLGTRSLVRWMK